MNLGRVVRRCTPVAFLVVAGCGGNPEPNTAGQGQRDPCSGAWVRLFDDANFSDGRLTINYPTEHGSLKAAGTDGSNGDLSDRVSSVRWSIPPGCRLTLYEDENFRGTRFQLIGSGRTEENSDLGAFSDKASSARWERG